jgi:predicted CXXCH cytochrome family protein
VRARQRKFIGLVVVRLLISPPAFLFAQSMAEFSSASPPNSYVGNQACARCHSAIYESYERTAMARASGPATENFLSGEFTHRKSSVDYRIYTQDGQVWLTFKRLNDPSVRGKRELLYYIGSGHRGRSYLFAVDGFFFESPVNWYSNEHTWDMAPAYQGATEIPLNLPAYPSCLQCHVSEMKPPLKGTENRYPSPPFAFAGVTCERCHGPGAAHIRGGPIVNPAKLAPERRDSICRQCHLEGKVAIERAGRRAYEFRPGELLSEYVRYYVLSTQRNGLGAVSQVEAMEQSRCKRKTGDAMSCTSCHDPHSSPVAEQRASYFRARCLACHGHEFGEEKHHAEQPDCIQCHMPSLTSMDIAHTQVTNHSIPRLRQTQPPLRSEMQAAAPSLVPFPDYEDARRDLRDLSLAWATLAGSGRADAVPTAERLLRAAASQSPTDPALLAPLGYLEQKRGAADSARELYEKALALDPDLIDAAANLGVIHANAGRLREAIKLWNGVFERAPARSAVGMNIAAVLCAQGQFDGARSVVMRVLEFNPDMASARALLQGLNHAPPACK